MKDQLDRIAWIWIAGLALLLGFLIALNQLAGLLEPVILLPSGGEVGAYGPLGWRFSQVMQKESVESRWSISPATPGRFVWDAQVLWYYPAEPLIAGGTYTIRLEAGVSGLDGRTSRSTWSWEVEVRQPRIAYLFPARSGADLWLASGGGETIIQLTHSGGKVFDYAVARDGQKIIYSASNDRNGLDLWLVGRDGRDEKRLLDCGDDECSQPAWSVDGKIIAYSRKAGTGTGKTAVQPRLWTVEVSSGFSSPLITNDQVSGQYPSFSPDGRRLSFFDITNGGLRVLDLATGKSAVLPSSYSPQGSWSADGNRLLYNVGMTAGGQPSVSVYEANLQTESVRMVMGEDLNQVDYSAPVWSPDGDWLVVGLRLAGGSYSKQLWLVSLDGKQRQNISNDFTYTHAAYSWAPGRQALLFQRLNLASSDAIPEVLVWDQSSQKMNLIGRNAALPAWIP